MTSITTTAPSVLWSLKCLINSHQELYYHAETNYKIYGNIHRPRHSLEHEHINIHLRRCDGTNPATGATSAFRYFVKLYALSSLLPIRQKKGNACCLFVVLQSG